MMTIELPMNVTDERDNKNKTIMIPLSATYITMYGVNGLRLSNKQAKENKIDKIMIHPMYKKTGIDDIALIKLRKDIEFKANRNRFIVNAVCLPTKNKEVDRRVVFAGWGGTFFSNSSKGDPIRLQRTEYSVINGKKCRKAILEKPQQTENDTELVSQIVAVFADSPKFVCILADSPPGAKWVNQSNTMYSGDSGGPLIQYYNGRAHSVGVASFGFKQSFNIAVIFFTKTSYFINWILRQIRANQWLVWRPIC